MSARLAQTTLRRIPASASRTQRVAVRGTRFNSTAAPKQADSSHAVAGLAGGAVVLGGVYAYYHYSGTAKVVNTAKSSLAQAQDAKDKLLQSTPSPKEALDLLKSFSKTYAAAIPGASVVLDSTFSKIDSLIDEHGEEVNKIASKTYEDLKKAVEDKKGSAEKVLAVLKETSEKVQKLVEEKGGEAWSKLSEKSPELAKTLGGSGDELKKLGEKHGPEAQKIATSTYSEASSILSSGGLNAKTYEKIKSLIETKTKEIKSLGEKAGKDAWEASQKQFGPLLEKLDGESKKKAEEYLDQVKGVVGEDRVKAAKDLYGELEKITTSKSSTSEKTKQATKLLEDKFGSLDELKKKASEGAKEGGDVLSQYKDKIPGLGGVLGMFEGKDLEHIKNLAEKHGEEAEKLLNSTYDEIKEVLKKKLEEAKKVGGDAKEDAKKEAKK